MKKVKKFFGIDKFGRVAHVRELEKDVWGKVTGKDAAEAADESNRQAILQQQQADSSRAAALQAQENMAINARQNLSQENVAQVVAGGTADEVVSNKRKRRASGLASTLGLSE